ncbi:MAG: hypothetical protein V2A76_16540 [Planctomycetota bacterium]
MARYFVITQLFCVLLVVLLLLDGEGPGEPVSGSVRKAASLTHIDELHPPVREEVCPSEPLAEIGADGRGRPDADGVGGCSLTLRLTDQATGQPVATEVWLLRSDDSTQTTLGFNDEQIGRFDVPWHGRTIRELRPGTYRLICGAESCLTAGSEPFEVGGRTTELVLAIELPRCRSAHLLVFDEVGNRIHDAQLLRGDSLEHAVALDDPEWVDLEGRDAAPREPMMSYVEDPLTRAASFRSAGGWAPVGADPLGFWLGQYGGDSRRWLTTHDILLKRAGKSNVLCVVQGRDPGDRIYFSVMIDPRPVLESIRLPDGTSAASFPESVSIVATSPTLDELGTDKPWEKVPIYVGVCHPGFHPFSFSFRLEDGDLGARTLSPVQRLESRSGLVFFQPFGSLGEESAEEWNETQQAVWSCFLYPGIGRTDRRAKRVLLNAEERAVPAYINALNGLDLSRTSDLQKADRLVHAILDTSAGVIRIPLHGNVLGLPEDVAWNQKAIRSLVDYWGRYYGPDAEAHRARLRQRIAERRLSGWPSHFSGSYPPQKA